MANEFTDLERHNFTASQAKMDLLEALLEPEDAVYPWDTADPESETYFANREEELVLEDWLEPEMRQRAQTFFTKLTELWEDVTPQAECFAVTTDANTLRVTLQQRFAAHLPQGWLDAIASQAHQVFSTPITMADALVQCVQSLLPSWTEEDLLVLARPFAYSMRGSETEASEFFVDSEDWTKLSEIEQAKASLAIAHYALDQLQKSSAKET